MVKTLIATPDFERPKESLDTLRIKAHSTLSNAIEAGTVNVVRSDVVTHKIGDRALHVPSFFVGLEFNAVSDRQTYCFELGRRVAFLDDLTEAEQVTMPALRRSVFEAQHDEQQVAIYPNARKYNTFGPTADGYSPIADKPELPWAPEIALTPEWSDAFPRRVMSPLALNMTVKGTNNGYDVTFLDRKSSSSLDATKRRIQRETGNAMIATDERLPDMQRDTLERALDLMTGVIAEHDDR